MEQPLVSVIVPMYNAQNTIRRCVESICGQSYPNLEILLLNDGSKDDTLAVCRELAAADARIRLIDKPNSGASDTRNQGLALARGEYIQFADSDDYLLPGCTERLVSAARRHKAALVLAPFWVPLTVSFALFLFGATCVLIGTYADRWRRRKAGLP